jgi:alpha-beta hydrolase superfamily lysophospholipase
MTKIAIYVVVAVVALGFVAALRIAVSNYRGERSDFERSPAAQASRHPELTGIPDLHEISFAAPNEPSVAAWYAPSRNRAAIILVHGTGADRSSLLAETRILAAAGFGVLALDIPGQGASGGRTLWGVPERHAISAAVEWLSHRAEVDPQRIGGFGLSMGAYVLTQTAVSDKRIRAVVLVGCPNDVVEQNWVTSAKWGWLSQWPTYWALRASGMPLDLLPKNIIGGISPRAVLIIGGTLDQVVPSYMARKLYDAAGSPKEIWIAPGANHTDYAVVLPQEYRNRLVGFFSRTLLD